MTQLVSPQFELADDFEAVQRLYLEKGWSDGLPIVPPTTERVEAMVEGSKLDPQHVVTEVPLCYVGTTGVENDRMAKPAGRAVAFPSKHVFTKFLRRVAQGIVEK